jgi:uncharacterized DUF497 family protein
VASVLIEVRFKRIARYGFRVGRCQEPTKPAGRGFGFDHATAIFIAPTLEAQDTRRDYGEVRVQAIGRAGDDILYVVYSDRNEVRRVISARLANK